MIYNMIGGGANQLNFKVVGSATEPSNPAENTIWVQTSISLTTVEFSDQQVSPSWAMPAGYCYISIDGGYWSSDYDARPAFDLVHKEKLIVYVEPKAVYLNTDGTASGWASVNAYIYKSGAWVDWIITLYKNGVEKVPFEAYTSNVTEDSSYLIIHPAHNNFGIWGTSSPIDLTGKKSVDASFYNMKSNSTFVFHEVKVMVAKSKITNSADAIAVKADTALTEGTLSLDISNLSGEYYVAVQFYHTSSNNASASVRFTGVTLS